MHDRLLGSTGLTVSEIGFGAWGIGGVSNGAIGYGPTDDRESLRALRRAFELGMTFYDTAALYGYGHSERLIGTALKDVRARVVLASKVGFLNAEGSQDFSPDRIRTSLEGSLRRLQTDYLDLYQLHDPSLEVLERDDRIMETLQALKREGKIRAVGLTARSPDDALDAIRQFGVSCVQVNFNMLDQRARENGLMTRCLSAHVGLIIRTPLCFGFLTGGYSSESLFDSMDHRSRWPAEQRARWVEGHRVFAGTTQGPATAAQAALRFCLSYPAVSTVIPGMLAAQHVEENTVASQLGPLTQSERIAVEKIYTDHQFFVGRESHSVTGGAHAEVS